MTGSLGWTTRYTANNNVDLLFLHSVLTHHCQQVHLQIKQYHHKNESSPSLLTSQCWFSHLLLTPVYNRSGFKNLKDRSSNIDKIHDWCNYYNMAISKINSPVSSRASVENVKVVKCLFLFKYKIIFVYCFKHSQYLSWVLNHCILLEHHEQMKMYKTIQWHEWPTVRCTLHVCVYVWNC